jgi:hypothetical protein
VQIGTKMTTYKNYTIEKLTRKGIYQIIDNTKTVVGVLPLLRDCKKFIDKKQVA